MLIITGQYPKAYPMSVGSLDDAITMIRQIYDRLQYFKDNMEKSEPVPDEFISICTDIDNLRKRIDRFVSIKDSLKMSHLSSYLK